jgi:hypothetical protein
MWNPSSSGRLLEKNVALDAVMGVLGVFVKFLVGGGVWCLPSWSPIGVGREAIRADVGVLSGRRFRGGNRSGWRFFLFRLG